MGAGREDVFHLIEVGGDKGKTLHLKDRVVGGVDKLQGQVDGAVHQALNDDVLSSQGVGKIHLHGDGTVGALLNEVSEAQGGLGGNVLLRLGGGHLQDDGISSGIAAGAIAVTCRGFGLATAAGCQTQHHNGAQNHAQELFPCFVHVRFLQL